jgi:hypothetical protein
MLLRDIAHGRSGDKGAISTISVIARRAENYPQLLAHVTEARVAEHFRALTSGPVKRHELPGIGALNFVITGALAGGVTRSLALDAHGKSLSSHMLDMEIPAPD